MRWGAENVYLPTINFKDARGRDSKWKPKHPRRRDEINSPSLPPGDFVSVAMDVAVMGSTEGLRVTNLHLDQIEADSTRF
jgi:hypothetical protein